MKELEQTFILEIQRLYEKAKQGPLDANDVNILVKLTSAWKNYQGAQIDDKVDDFDELSTEDLLLLARDEVEDED
jgi:hypothetical protein